MGCRKRLLEISDCIDGGNFLSMNHKLVAGVQGTSTSKLVRFAMNNLTSLLTNPPAKRKPAAFVLNQVKSLSKEPIGLTEKKLLNDIILTTLNSDETPRLSVNANEVDSEFKYNLDLLTMLCGFQSNRAALDQDLARAHKLKSLSDELIERMHYGSVSYESLCRLNQTLFEVALPDNLRQYSLDKIAAGEAAQTAAIHQGLKFILLNLAMGSVQRPIESFPVSPVTLTDESTQYVTVYMGWFDLTTHCQRPAILGIWQRYCL